MMCIRVPKRLSPFSFDLRLILSSTKVAADGIERKSKLCSIIRLGRKIRQCVFVYKLQKKEKHTQKEIDEERTRGRERQRRKENRPW